MPAQSSKEGAQQTSPGESSCGFEPTQPSISSLAIFRIPRNKLSTAHAQRGLHFADLKNRRDKKTTSEEGE